MRAKIEAMRRGNVTQCRSGVLTVINNNYIRTKWVTAYMRIFYGDLGSKYKLL